ncbi:MAG: SLC45 family MFS transporter [Cloacibacterium normanense]|jgi:maltose/moltooligosaccharide transporter|uniref:Reduced folate carrier family protein n=1 Tax=Cloacibacterium normanense TaxID=237258 RepID=A0A1E5UEG0_9FLAO|nr:MFS transporter [Cloacibacterium normanense]AZI69097.1 MFS transporter [Cloacibacterium normanense]MBF1149426.1 SLC45 family MFS transporter [Cloacibacterium normanense]OEL11286.1 reduced folate carrier family protein [Cloacibacterium normanense]SDO12873.1 maltose/moltooligosaccharide transporter [Cloacibacterium normanense]
MSNTQKKPLLSFWQIWNISFGFLGVQIGYSLQNANTSRILSAIGADVHHLSYFWLAAPLAGLFVQPIVGLSSDKTWTRLGRRIPFILGGAIVSALAMFFMPNSEHFAQLFPAVFFGAMMLLFMDVSFNVTMQPFRALVSDMVDESQRNKGYSIQSFLINVGAVFGSLLPFLLTWWGIANEPEAGQKVAPTVIWSFYIGGAVLLASVLWTSFRTKEYPPEEYAKYNNLEEKENENPEKVSFFTLIKNVPNAMKQLAVTQFFSWFALFLMWVYTTQGIAQNIWGTTDATSNAFNEAGNWTGVIFAAYSVFAALFSLVITPLADKYGRRNVYVVSLILGGLGLLSMLFIKDKNLLFLPMIGVGIAWAAILALPYAILSSKLPAKQTGVYMGIFNATITIPQIAAGLLGGVLLSALGGTAINMVALAGVSMAVAGIAALLVIKE